MSKLRYILLLIFGITSQVNIARAQQVQPYKPMTASEWNEAKKGFSDSLLQVIGDITKRESLITDVNNDDIFEVEEDEIESSLPATARIFRVVFIVLIIIRDSF